MKSKKENNLKYKLIKLELIKSNITQNTAVANRLKAAEVYLRKALKIIFLYHIRSKPILFVGIPKTTNNIYKERFKKSCHLFLPHSYWIRGLLTNKATVYRYIERHADVFTPERMKSYFSLAKKPSLIVLFDAKTQKEVLTEAVKLRIPVIALNSDMLHGNGISYQLPISINNNDKKSNFFVALLNSMFKRRKIKFNV